MKKLLFISSLFILLGTSSFAQSKKHKHHKHHKHMMKHRSDEKKMKDKEK